MFRPKTNHSAKDGYGIGIQTCRDRKASSRTFWQRRHHGTWYRARRVRALLQRCSRTGCWSASRTALSWSARWLLAGSMSQLKKSATLVTWAQSTPLVHLTPLGKRMCVCWLVVAGWMDSWVKYQISAPISNSEDAFFIFNCLINCSASSRWGYLMRKKKRFIAPTLACLLSRSLVDTTNFKACCLAIVRDLNFKSEKSIPKIPKARQGARAISVWKSIWE